MKLTTDNLYSFRDSMQGDKCVPALYHGYLIKEDGTKVHFFQVWNVVSQSTWKQNASDSWRSESLTENQLTGSVKDWVN